MFVNMLASARAVTCTGSRGEGGGGGGLSALLYILYTYDCRSNQESSYLVKFTDDGVLLFLHLGTQDGHGAALDDFTERFDKSYLHLNVTKTKETMADFRR